MAGCWMKFAVKCMYSLPCMLFVVLRYMNGVIFMSHTVFFLSTEHTDTHGFFPQSEVFERILVKDFIWGLVAYSKTSSHRLPPKINILLLLIHLVLIFQASDRNHINPIFSSISEIACSCKYHHERWFIHFFCIYFTRKS